MRVQLEQMIWTHKQRSRSTLFSHFQALLPLPDRSISVNSPLETYILDGPERAAAFCRSVFAWEIIKWDGHFDCWLVRTGPREERG